MADGLDAAQRGAIDGFRITRIILRDFSAPGQSFCVRRLLSGFDRGGGLKRGHFRRRESVVRVAPRRRCQTRSGGEHESSCVLFAGDGLSGIGPGGAGSTAWTVFPSILCAGITGDSGSAAGSISRADSSRPSSSGDGCPGDTARGRAGPRAKPGLSSSHYSGPGEYSGHGGQLLRWDQWEVQSCLQSRGQCSRREGELSAGQTAL